MGWVIALLLSAFLLILLEVAVVPGTTFVGLGGLVLLIVGVVASFHYFSWQGGWSVLGITVLLLGGLLYFAFRANTWKKISLRTTSLGRLKYNETSGLKIGIEGTAISSLRPGGKAEINGKVYEVKTFGEFVSAGTNVQIVQVMPNQVIVKPV